MTEAEQNKLIDDHFLFDKPVSPLLTSAGINLFLVDLVFGPECPPFLERLNQDDFNSVYIVGLI